MVFMLGRLMIARGTSEMPWAPRCTVSGRCGAMGIIAHPLVTLAIGTRLGPYEVLAFVGAGGMGQVYRARDTTLNRDVALKILPDGMFLDPDRVGRFKREAQVLASLNHPNVGAIYGFE